ncbi:MAG: patatin-like phospholipase family protein [Candidatus Aminicenantes bacterium]
MSKQKIGLALGSGAVRGYAIIPIIKRLEKEGIEISAVSGSSVGSLIGAYYSVHGEVDSFMKISKGLTRKDFLKLVDLNNPTASIIKGKKIRDFLAENYLGNKTFDDAKIPLYICVTDAVQKKPIYLNQGDLLDSVMASISIPGIFPPYKIGNTIYIDGGVLDPVPAKPLLDRGMKKLIAINLTGFRRGKKKRGSGGLLTDLMDSFYMMMEQLAKEPEDKRIFMLNPLFEPEPARMLAFYDWEENYKIGQKLINRKIKELKSWLKK